MLKKEKTRSRVTPVQPINSVITPPTVMQKKANVTFDMYSQPVPGSKVNSLLMQKSRKHQKKRDHETVN
jgi:hypothetical protein